MGEMTREDILRMAGEAGLLFGETEEERFYEYQYGWQQYAKFASLVAAAERDACLQQTQIVVEAEREACATIIQRAGLPSIADAIRARGKG
jgi:hypothetical protein